MTGDLPTMGFGGRPRGVFDLDSVSLITLLHAMNEGLEIAGSGGTHRHLPPTDFFVGCAVSPFKALESELMPQFFKLVQKIERGAQWAITQLGYDMRKSYEVQLFLAWARLDVPLIGNVFLLVRGVAECFHQARVPGCVVNDQLRAQVCQYAAGPDHGRGFCEELAARQLSAYRALGFAGGYLGGANGAEQVCRIINLAEAYTESDGRDFANQIQFAQPDEFYLFERDAASGLGDGQDLNHHYLQSLEKRSHSREVTLGYRIVRRFHEAVFAQGGGHFDRLQKLYRALDQDNTNGHRPI